MRKAFGKGASETQTLRVPPRLRTDPPERENTQAYTLHTFHLSRVCHGEVKRVRTSGVFIFTPRAARQVLFGMNVSTYMGTPSNPVTMVAQMGALMDGANYPARTDLSVPSSKIEVEVVNTGYRKM